VTLLRGGAYKYLARPTSRFRRTESIVSLEKEICSCAEFARLSLLQRLRGAHQAMHAISTTSRRELSSFLFLQGKAAKEIHAILTETLREYSPLYTTVKNWVARFKRGDFSTCDAPRPGRPKTVTIPDIIDQIHELILENCRISAKSIAEQLGISHYRVGSIIHEDLDMRKMPQHISSAKSAGKFVASVFWDQDGIFLIDSLPMGQTIKRSITHLSWCN